MNRIKGNEQHRLYLELRELLRSDDRIFDFIEHSSLDGLWFWDLENPEHEWMSAKFWTTLGYDPSSKQHLASEWQEIINQDDLKLAVENFEKHCADPTYPYDQIVRYTHSSGRTVWIRCRGMAIRDENGKPIRMLGAHTDVSALKEQELERVDKETQQKLAFKKQALLLDDLERTANIGTWEVDLIAQTVTWSPETKRIHEVPNDYQPTLETGINFYKEGESRRRITEAVELGISNGTPWDLELELVTATGREIWVRALGKPEFVDGECVRLFGVFQDISRQKEVEHQLTVARENAEAGSVRLQLAHDSIGMGVWEWDLVTNDLIWDKWMYLLYGVSEGQFSGAFEAWEASIHPEDIEKAKSLLNLAIAEKSSYDTDFRVIGPDGAIKNIKANATVITDKAGAVVKVIGVNYDITDRVRNLEVLRQAKLRAEALTKAKGDFLANMSHEIRTPMNAILGGLQLLKNAELDENLRTILNNAVFSAQSLLTILNDILDYSKIESNKLSLESAAFSLTEIVNSVEYDLNALVNNKGISFSTVIADDFVDGFIGDIVRVKQILLNLASNAVKFTNKGGVTIEVGFHEQNDSRAICIRVIDSGIGMSEEAQRRIFERFSQADTSTTRKYGGTGLGMSITYSLVEMMKGQLHLHSVEGKGTTITVILPLEQTPVSPKHDINAGLSAPIMRGKKILIAEDNHINQVVIQSMLEPTQANITLVDNGKHAVDAISKEDFDLILMDIHMPEMDGVQAQQQIKMMKKHIPVIALTANVMPEDIAEYVKQGFASHLGKPVDMNMLYSLLNQYSN
ncbi:PAS domain-containing protein [Aestuariibacter salexigens]|uniref:PAS domain-containing protein n=1 Tax=Aestuariibacter salexigens TaxID=226010 RepID=UPI00041315AB|nr:PAS domain-containing protein [Aestuariibacter salexigens]